MLDLLNPNDFVRSQWLPLTGRLKRCNRFSALAILRRWVLLLDFYRNPQSNNSLNAFAASPSPDVGLYPQQADATANRSNEM